MKLSPAQLRALRNLDVAIDTHGNALFWEWDLIQGWFNRQKRGVRLNTWKSLLNAGLVEKHHDWYVYRISAAGADELRQRGYVVYTHAARQQPAPPDEGGA